MSVPAAQPGAQQQQQPTQYPQAFSDFIAQNEINSVVASQLYLVLSQCDIVLLCDDSGSMQTRIAPEYGSNKPATTRWQELKTLAQSLIQICTVTNPNGLDIYFFNRPMLQSVNLNNMGGLQQTFNNLPAGGTPLCGTLTRIFNDKGANLAPGRSLLVVCITDGEPSDGSRQDLFNVLNNKSSNIHVSLAECTDNAEDMEYLDSWDGRIKNFDNTDDYREELKRVKKAKGNNFKFDYMDYSIKILLATYLRWYFQVDQSNAGCCVIL